VGGPKIPSGSYLWGPSPTAGTPGSGAEWISEHRDAFSAVFAQSCNLKAVASVIQGGRGVGGAAPDTIMVSKTYRATQGSQ